MEEERIDRAELRQQLQEHFAEQQAHQAAQQETRGGVRAILSRLDALEQAVADLQRRVGTEHDERRKEAERLRHTTHRPW